MYIKFVWYIKIYKGIAAIAVSEDEEGLIS
jgi:hypothetical protein